MKVLNTAACEIIFVGILCLMLTSPMLLPPAHAGSSSELFTGEQFTENDAVLVSDKTGNVLYDWQANKLLIPASLTKLATAQLAIDKWGLQYQFLTDYYLLENALWVKGYGDPFLVSEELDLVVKALEKAGVNNELEAINIDNSYFNITDVPGRTKVDDPYNAPLSAVAANFNTAKLRRLNGVVNSAESQTPLTPTAIRIGGALKAISERVNLVNSDNAQTNFAELLVAKLALAKTPRAAVSININESLPPNARLVYRHRNSRTLADVLSGTLEFSNNFMANQVFLKLADQTDAVSVAAKPVPVSFARAVEFAKKQLDKRFKWTDYTIVEGSGLSRSNRLSAHQINDLLNSLAPHKTLFKRIDIKSSQASVFAKTGTLEGVRTYAGYIALKDNDYRFVFIFNRSVAWRYREKMLERLVGELSAL